MSEFDKIIDDLKKLDKKLNKFKHAVKILEKDEKIKILNYCNLCKKFHNDKYLNKKNIPINNKKFKNLFSTC